MIPAEVVVERATRLRRYLRKDYSHVVEFPVEIVGRDGLVRRYSFDDSVRLYQRRIHSAVMRYDDGDLVDAEVRHCRTQSKLGRIVPHPSHLIRVHLTKAQRRRTES